MEMLMDATSPPGGGVPPQPDSAAGSDVAFVSRQNGSLATSSVFQWSCFRRICLKLDT